MKPTILLALHSTAIAIATLAPDTTAQRRGRDANPELEHLTFAAESFESDALGGRDVSYGVYLPKSYGAAENAKKRYPLVIWLHGMWEDHLRFHGRGGGTVLDAMTGEKTVPEMVFVCANGGRSSFYVNGSSKDDDYEDMVRNELVARIETSYRVHDHRSQRAIAGVSMGGYGALKIALKDPEAFGVVAAHSAALLTVDPDDLETQYPWLRGRGKALLTALFGDPVDKEKWATENVLVLAEDLVAERLDGLKIYFDCGDEDRYGFQQTNGMLHELLTQREIPHVWRLVEGGNHGWRGGYNQSAVPHSLRFLAEQFAGGKAKAGLGGLLGGNDDKGPSKDK